MTLFVDTSAWSLALRRDAEVAGPEADQLRDALLGADVVVTTGLVLQELLQGFSGAKSSAQMIERFAALPILQPDREDHIAAAELRKKTAEQVSRSGRSMPCLRNSAFATS